MTLRFVSEYEFRAAMDILRSFTNSDPTKTCQLEIDFEKYARINAKFIVSLYFEQIRMLTVLTPQQLLDTRKSG